MDQKPSHESIESENTNLKKQIEALKNSERINYTLYDISNAVNTTRNLKELYQSIYSSLNRLMPLPNFYIAIYDNNNKIINFDYFIDEYDDDFPIIENIEDPICLTGEVINAKRPLFLKENMLIERNRKNKIVGKIPKIWLGVPLIIQDTVFGVICVQHYSDPKYFSRQHLEILVSVSDQIAVAIERKQILDALENKEKTLSLIFDNNPDSILITRMDTGTIFDVNKAFLDLSSLDRNDVIGKTTREIGMWKDDHQHPALIARLKEKDSYKNLEATLFLNHKTIFTLVSSKVMNLEGIPHIISIIRDISDRKSLEEHLSQRQKMDSVGTLAGGIAHDVNNLLSGIVGYIELLGIDQDAMPDSQKESIANALISSKKAAKLIRQLRALTQSNTSDPSNVDIYKIAADVFNMLGQITNPLIEKRIEFSENQFFAKGYKDDLHQVLMNLCMNAVQAIEEKPPPSPDSYIRIFIPNKRQGMSKSGSFPDSEYLHICFQDNGCGMTPEIRGKAFDPMFSAWKIRSRKSQGLGLAMAYYIITQKHQGFIDIETLTGKGTTFHIYLPVAAKPVSEKKQDDTSLKRLKTILVIEDEDMVRDMAVKALKTFGYSTLDACDGEAGLSIFKKNHQSIDAVLLDIIMPKISGTETFKQMLNIDPNVKVIVASGHVTNQDQKKIFAKACAYLDKPYQIMELKQALESILK